MAVSFKGIALLSSVLVFEATVFDRVQGLFGELNHDGAFLSVFLCDITGRTDQLIFGHHTLYRAEAIGFLCIDKFAGKISATTIPTGSHNGKRV